MADKPVRPLKYVAPRFTDTLPEPQYQELDLQTLQDRVTFLERHLALVERLVRDLREKKDEPVVDVPALGG